MKTFGKIVICILVISLAIGVSYLIYNKGNNSENTSTNALNTTKGDIKNNISNTSTQDEYIGLEENVNIQEEKEDNTEENVSQENEKQEEEKKNEEQPKVELTGKEKAIDVVKKQYALEGQTVSFDHMEGENYIVKINEGTALTWYLVNGTTWEAEEY